VEEQAITLVLRQDQPPDAVARDVVERRRAFCARATCLGLQRS